jgi:hypothetical protein
MVAPAERPRIQLIAPALDLTAPSPVGSTPVADGLSTVSRPLAQLAPLSSLLHRPSLQNLFCTLLI